MNRSRPTLGLVTPLGMEEKTPQRGAGAYISSVDISLWKRWQPEVRCPVFEEAGDLEQFWHGLELQLCQWLLGDL